VADYSEMMRSFGKKPQSAASGGSSPRSALTPHRKTGTISSVPKRKLSRKARAAALKNLAKARRARKSKRHVKSTRRASRKASMPRKRRRSRKQIAAARQNIKKAHAGKRRKKICRRAAGKRGAAKRLRRRMPSMPRICKPKRRKARRARKATHHVGHRKSPKRIAAGKKAARTRKRSRGVKTEKMSHIDRYYATAMESPRRRRRRKGRRKNPVLANPIANPRRRRRTHHRRHHAHHARRHHRMRNPLPNPLTGTGEFVAGLFGVGSGFLLASITDRLAATHPLTTAAPGVFTDTPAPGQVYDSEATQLPIWKDPMRLGVAFVTIMAPGLITKYVVRGSKAKAFAQLATFGAIGRTVGKALDDGIAVLAAGTGPLSTNMYAQRLYGAELAASSRLAQLKAGSGPLVGSAAGTSLTQPAGQFAGVPDSARGLAGTPSQYLSPPSRMIGDCTPIDPQMNHTQTPLPPFNLDSVSLDGGGGGGCGANNTDSFCPYTAGQDNCCPLPPQLPNVSMPPAPYVAPPVLVPTVAPVPAPIPQVTPAMVPVDSSPAPVPHAHPQIWKGPRDPSGNPIFNAPPAPSAPAAPTPPTYLPR
jgi:hypothetical protein